MRFWLLIAKGTFSRLIFDKRFCQVFTAFAWINVIRIGRYFCELFEYLRLFDEILDILFIIELYFIYY